MIARPRWDRIVHALLDAVGVVGLLMGLYRFVQLTRGWMTYDEGILLSHTWVLLHGGWPFRDFYTQYPPGIYLLLAAVWKVFGVSVLADRILSDVIRLGVALLAGVIGGRLGGRRFAALPAGMVTMWLSVVAGPPFAWFGALLFALGAVLALERAVTLRSRAYAVAAGAVLALTFSFRHDLALYFCVALAPVAAYALFIVRPRPRQVLRAAGYLAAGAAPVLAIFWLPTLIAARWSVIYGDLYADQVRYVMPGRKLPLPPLLDRVDVSYLPFRIPVCLDEISSTNCALVIVAPILALWVFVRTRRRPGRGLLAALVAALALAVIPHIMGRGDFNHLFYTVPLGLLLLGTIPYGWGDTPAWRIGLGGLLVVAFSARAMRADFPPHPPLIPPVAVEATNGSPQVGLIPDGRGDARRQLRAYVDATLAPGEPVYIGNQAHDTVFINEVDLYFVLDRPPVQRYLQFDPGIVTRRKVQEEMIRGIEAKKPRMAILSDASSWQESGNDSSRHDSKVLDIYLGAYYQLDRTIGPYKILRRRPDLPPN